MERRIHGARHRSLRPVRAQLIIPSDRLDGAVPAPTRCRSLTRRRVMSHGAGWSKAAMPDPQLAIDRSPALDDSTASITELLADLRGGRREAFDQLLPLVYHELRRTARRELKVRPSDTLSTTALVHELYLKLSRAKGADWRDRPHFLSVAAVAMRHILVDRARRRTAEKRGGSHRHVTLDDQLTRAEGKAESLLELHDALDQLAILDERLARVVECRFFGGMTEQETAEALCVTERTVRRDWIKARGLLIHALGAEARGRRAP